MLVRHPGVDLAPLRPERRRRVDRGPRLPPPRPRPERVGLPECIGALWNGDRRDVPGLCPRSAVGGGRARLNPDEGHVEFAAEPEAIAALGTERRNDETADHQEDERATQRRTRHGYTNGGDMRTRVAPPSVRRPPVSVRPSTAFRPRIFGAIPMMPRMRQETFLFRNPAGNAGMYGRLAPSGTMIRTRQTVLPGKGIQHCRSRPRRPPLSHSLLAPPPYASGQ